VYSFGTSGSYTVKFEGSGVAGSCKGSIIVTVKPSPEINISFLTNDTICFEDNQICFIDSTKSIFGQVVTDSGILTRRIIVMR